jgi:hypothetical protein
MYVFWKWLSCKCSNYQTIEGPDPTKYFGSGGTDDARVRERAAACGLIGGRVIFTGNETGEWIW